MNHDECREKVCIVCIGKASYSHKITPKLVDLLKLYARDDFSIDDSAFPSGICNTCHLAIHKKAREPESTVLAVEPFQPNREPHLRSKVVCDCRICEVAKISGAAAKKMKKKRGRPSTTPPAPSPTTMCAVCFTHLYVGCAHDCSKKTKLANIEKMLESPTKTTSRKLLDREKRKRGEKKQKVVSISGDNLATIGKNMNFSIRKTKELAQNIRTATGCRSVIERFADEKIRDDRHRLDDHFEYHNMLMIEVDAKKKTERKYYEHTVLCKDVNALVEEVILVRNIEPSSMFIRVGLDGGGGFLKFCLSIFDIDSLISPSSEVAKKYKDSGVKKALIIAISPEVQENYSSIKKLWWRVGLLNFKYKFTIATDLKLINILLGLQNHSSTHPCAWCDVDKSNLDKKGKQRTFESILELFHAYDAANMSKEHAKDYGNVIHPPIFDVDDQGTPVIHVIPPPELHLLLGPTNHLIDALSKVWPGCIAWLQSLNLYKEEYFGGTYEGNECRKILKNIDSLKQKCPREFAQFVTTFETFNEVVKSCYGFELAEDFIERIDEFKQSYLKLKDVSVTPKVHAVFYHIPEFCLFAGRGLGAYSEQAVESLHTEFKKSWESFYVKNTANDKYPERFLRAVQTFNSMHL